MAEVLFLQAGPSLVVGAALSRVSPRGRGEGNWDGVRGVTQVLLMAELWQKRYESLQMYEP